MLYVLDDVSFLMFGLHMSVDVLASAWDMLIQDLHHEEIM